MGPQGSLLSRVGTRGYTRLCMMEVGAEHIPLKAPKTMVSEVCCPSHLP